MIVRRPLNINDEDLTDNMTLVDQPTSQPTAMSYSLQRIRLSEIARNIVDRTPLAMAHADLSHDVLTDIDTELQCFINDIPPFFSMYIHNLIETYQLDPSRAAKIRHQGYMIHCLAYSQRCQFHLPYFGRGFINSSYAFSREICVQSARRIIQIELQQEQSDLCTALRYRFIGFLTGIFMASIVLLMDLCHNKSSPQQDEQRGEIAGALRMLEEAKHESKTATKFQDSLMHILHKHKTSKLKEVGLPPPKPGIGTENLSTAASEESVFSTASATQTYSVLPDELTPMDTQIVPTSNKACNEPASGEDISSYFNDMAQSLEQGLDFNSFDWNNMLSELDPSLI